MFCLEDPPNVVLRMLKKTIEEKRTLHVQQKNTKFKKSNKHCVGPRLPYLGLQYKHCGVL